MKEMEEVVRIFPQKLRALLFHAKTQTFAAEELRLRANRPLLMEAKGQEWRLRVDLGEWERVEVSASASALSGLNDDISPYYRVSSQDIRDTLEYMSRYSLYAFDEELRQGFLTIPGGHRVGIAGQTVAEKSSVRTLRNISFLNIRVAREVKGCAGGLLPWLYQEGTIGSTLIISPPRCGKTTLLRDLIRQVSDGWAMAEGKKEKGSIFPSFIPGVTVGVVDERSELGACYQWVPQHDLGMRTDDLDACPKAEGIMMLIRSMAPRVVAVDEIGSREDMEALRYGINCGCRILATVHGNSLEDVFNKPLLRELAESGVFARYVLLAPQGPPGKVSAVLDREGRVICRRI